MSIQSESSQDQKSLAETFADIINRFSLRIQKNGVARGSCPAHKSKSGTGFVMTLASDRILVDCHGGCSFSAIAAATGHAESDFFAHDDNPTHGRPRASKPKPAPAQVLR